MQVITQRVAEDCDPYIVCAKHCHANITNVVVDRVSPAGNISLAKKISPVGNVCLVDKLSPVGVAVPCDPHKLCNLKNSPLH